MHVTWVAYEGQEDGGLLTRVCLSVPACQMAPGDRPSITLTMSLIQEREGTTTMEEQKKEPGLELGQAGLHHHPNSLAFFHLFFSLNGLNIYPVSAICPFIPRLVTQKDLGK